MHVNDKFHHTMQFHSALSLQKVALPYPFFLFSAIVAFTLGNPLGRFWTIRLRQFDPNQNDLSKTIEIPKRLYLIRLGTKTTLYIND